MEKTQSSIDILGIALQDYLNGNYTEDIITESTISEEDIMPIPYLFRGYAEMPDLEKKALDLCRGKILDVGSGSGSHSLYLQNIGLDVTAIDISPGAIAVCKKRGVKKALTQSLYTTNQKFDTVLLLMNGIGICGWLDNLDVFLQQLKHIMNIDGQVLLDSSDIKYMYEDAPELLQEVNHYYGEVTFIMKYKNQVSEAFEWLYLDYKTLNDAANKNEMKCELVAKGSHHDFLVRITLR